MTLIQKMEKMFKDIMGDGYSLQVISDKEYNVFYKRKLIYSKIKKQSFKSYWKTQILVIIKEVIKIRFNKITRCYK